MKEDMRDQKDYQLHLKISVNPETFKKEKLLTCK